MKKIIMILCVLLAVSMLLSSCNEKGNQTDTVESTQEQTEAETTRMALSGELLYIVAGDAMCGIVRAKNMSNDAINACSEMYFAIKAKTGVEIPFIDDSRKLDNGINEILIGNTSREESKKALAALGDNHWNITVINGKLCIVAVNDVILVEAVEKFTKDYVNAESDNSTTGILAVQKEISVKGVSEENSHSIYIAKGAELTVDIIPQPKLNVSTFSKGGYKLHSVQGGCTDGKHIYQIFITQDDARGVIVKSDIETQQIVKISDPIALGHANGATYNSDNDTIVVADHKNEERTTHLHILDAQTLTLQKTVIKDFFAYQIAYNEKTHGYIASSGAWVYILDGNFNVLQKSSGALTDGYYGQGSCTDGTYYYRLEYYINPDNRKDIRNNLRILDANTREEITLVELPITKETEFISIHDGYFYLVCNNNDWNGSNVFTFTLRSV